jgi:hypothetical protein
MYDPSFGIGSLAKPVESVYARSIIAAENREIVRNNQEIPLEPGTIVMIEGEMELRPLDDVPAALVRTATIDDSALYGVYDSAQSEDGWNREVLEVGQYGSVVTAGTYTHLKADDSNGEISPGDLLQLSSLTAGYTAKYNGTGKTVIGMALSSLDPETGEISASIRINYNLTVGVSGENTLLSYSDSGYDFANNGLLNVKFIASTANTWSISEAGTLTVKEVVAEKVKANTIETRDGMIITDRVTGQKYCVYMENGMMKNEAGECNYIQPQATSEPAPVQTSPETTSETTTEPQPESTSTQSDPTVSTDPETETSTTESVVEEPAPQVEQSEPTPTATDPVPTETTE